LLLHTQCILSHTGVSPVLMGGIPLGGVMGGCSQVPLYLWALWKWDSCPGGYITCIFLAPSSTSWADELRWEAACSSAPVSAIRGW
jgi:hypothetical protein